MNKCPNCGTKLSPLYWFDEYNQVFPKNYTDSLLKCMIYGTEWCYKCSEAFKIQNYTEKVNKK